MDVDALIALAEPTRLRIVELLRERPHAVGEVAQTLDLRQPQVTKHLQTLAQAGLVTVHPLGQRRICALEPTRFAELRDWLDGFTTAPAAALDAYRRAVDAETAAAAHDPRWAEGRTVTVARTLPAGAPAVWRHLTTPELMRAWWAPDHFTVADCAADPRPGGELRIVMAEGDGTRHAAAGRYTDVDEPHALGFEMSPLGLDGTPLFTAEHRVRLAPGAGGTELTLDVAITSTTALAAPAIAGLRLGWQQSLAKLARALTT